MSDFKAKMHQNRFRLELCPRPRWGTLQRSPGPLTENTSKGRGGKGGEDREGRGGKGMGGKGKEGEGEEGSGGDPHVYL